MQKLQQESGKDSFQILVDPSNDPYLSQLLSDMKSAIPENIIKDLESGNATKDELETVLKAMTSVLKERHIAYFPWMDSEDNLRQYLGTDHILLGDRLKNGYYTCYEAAVLTKTVLSQLGVQTDYNFWGIHTALRYVDKDGNAYDVELLLDKAINSVNDLF